MSVRLRWLLLALVSFSGVTSAQMLEEGTNYPLEKGQASDPLYGNRPARTMSHREFARLYEHQVAHPVVYPEALFGGFALKLDNGEISICEKAPEPSSLSLLLAGLSVMLVRRRAKQ